MKIALYNLTTTTSYGGVESFVWDLAAELVRRDHQVTVIGGRGARDEAAQGVRVATFPFVSRRRFQAIPPLRRAYAEAKLLERLTLALPALPLLAHSGFDIIHLQKPYDLAPALLARRLGGAKVILGCHGEDFYRGDRWLARQVDAAVSCSNFNARTIQRRYGFRPTVVFNGIDTALFRPTERDAALRQRLLAGRRAALLFVGRLQHWKGVETAIRALALLPQTTLTVAGDGTDRERLEALTAQLGLRERVQFVGGVARAELPAYYAAADLLIATSFASETFGIALVEAQACGLPVVASRWDGFLDVVDEGTTGLFYPPQDAAALADAARALLDDQPRRAAMGEAAIPWAAQFAWPSVADRIERVYRATLSH